MKNFNKKICLALVLTLILTSFAGCGDNKSASSNEKVDLVWMLAGAEQTDSKLVWEKFNEELNKREGFENYEIGFKLFPFADFAQKFMLFQTSGEKIDMVSTYNLELGMEVRNGTLYDMTDDMQTLAPDILKEIPDWALKLCQVDNKQYAITNYQQMAEAMYSPAFQALEADKYLDYDGFRAALDSSDTVGQEVYDALDTYFDTLKANGTLDMGMRPGTTWVMMKGYDVLSPYQWIFKRSGDGVKVEHFMETDAYKTLLKNADKFFKKGYIRKDVLSAELGKDAGKPNGYNVWHSQTYKGAEEAMTLKHNMPIRIINSENDYYVGIAANAGGNGILASSKYPKEALKFLNMMYTQQGKDMYRLLVYGIEGQHYTMVEGSDIRINPIGYVGNPGSTDAPYGLNKWIVGNCSLAYEAPTEAEGWIDYVFNEWNPSCKPSKLAGFVLDDEEFAAEFAQIGAITAEYRDMLASGSLADYEAKYKECFDKFKIAGFDKVKAAMQKQIDDYLASQK